MSEMFAKILQTYLFHRDCELRSGARGATHEWPRDRGDLSIAWRQNVSIAIEKLRHDDPSATIEDLSDREGYVKITVEGKGFSVPAPLMSFIPSAVDMLALYTAAQEAKLFSKSRICLSGSTVLTGRLNSVGDLDLFEYVSDNDLKRELLERDPQYAKGSFISTRVSVANTKGEFPAAINRTDLSKDEIYPKKMRTFAAKYLKEFNFAKVDMIGMFNGQVGEVTNIAYRHLNDWKFQPPFPSFPYQEVQTGSQSPEPRTYSLKNFGMYVFWLRDEVSELLKPIQIEHSLRPNLTDDATKKAIKLAKRAMSLSAMLGDDNSVQDFLDFLETRESRAYSLQSASKQLTPLLTGDTASSELAKKSMEWIGKKLSKLDEDAPPVLDVQCLVNSTLELIEKFDQLCFPNKPSEA